jgi:hypothetical protein
VGLGVRGRSWLPVFEGGECRRAGVANVARAVLLNILVLRIALTRARNKNQQTTSPALWRNYTLATEGAIWR